ncbi:MAG: type II secretion system protein N [Gammaproteobacteria bacterium]
MISPTFLKSLGQERAMKRLALAVNVMLGFLIGHQLTVFFGLVGEEHNLALPAGGASFERLAVARPDAVPSTSLEQLHLFGEPSMAKRQETVMQPPEVRPKLVLRGIIHSTNWRAARAIITEINGRDVAYPLGARLPGGIKLTKINYRNVVVSHRGGEELLYLSNKMTPGS